MKSAPLTVLFTHGNLAGALKSVTKNLGVAAENFYSFSNQEKSIKDIETEILELIKDKSPENIMIFVDLTGGSCWISAARLKKENDQIEIMGGVNIPMLVSYFMNVQRMDWQFLLEKVSADAKKGIARL